MLRNLSAFSWRGAARTAATFVLASALTLVGSGLATADENSSFDGCPKLDEGDSGPCVVMLQQRLNVVHPEYNLPETDFFGSKTRIAVLDFQGRNLLGPDGRFGSTTARELQRQYNAASKGAVATPQSKPIEKVGASSFDGCPTLAVGSTGPCVVKLQTMLDAIHPEYDLPGNDQYGQRTQRAVKDFQERNHITGGRGQFGQATATVLERQYSEGATIPDEPADPPKPPPSPDPRVCDGKASTSSDLAKRGDVVEVDHKLENKSGATLTLKFSPSSGCAWGLIGPVMTGSGAGVWLEYSENGGKSWSGEIAYRQITYTGGTKHTGAIPGERGNVRACADISMPDYTQKPGGPIDEAYSSDIFCTKTMKPL